MTSPRRHIAPPQTPGAYHCVQRCVRRAFLCGVDRYTGQCFEHRRNWIEARIRLVAECFAVSIHAYAVMSNHLHLVVQIDPAGAERWCDDEVASRWARLFPPREDTQDAFEIKCQRILRNPERLEVLRQRLGSLSWLMRCLVEPIARRANREDGCKGRFWEGRYKCQALCDQRSVLAAMAYVDLNPIRAGMADRLEASAMTSVAARIVEIQREPSSVSQPLKPILGDLRPEFPLSSADYLQLLDWTGRALAPGKRGRIAHDAPAILSTVDRDPQRWSTRVGSFGSGWCRAVGAAADLIELAERLGQRWIKGIRLALKLA